MVIPAHMQSIDSLLLIFVERVVKTPLAIVTIISEHADVTALLHVPTHINSRVDVPSICVMLHVTIYTKKHNVLVQSF